MVELSEMRAAPTADPTVSVPPAQKARFADTIGKLARPRNPDHPQKPSSTPTESPLTKREWEVVGWVASGLSNPQIGAKLGIATDTIDRLRMHATHKLGGRKNLLLAAMEQGLLAAPDPLPTLQRYAQFTPTMRQVANLVWEEKSYAETKEILGLTPRQIKTARREVMQTLGVRHHAGLMAALQVIYQHGPQLETIPCIPSKAAPEKPRSDFALHLAETLRLLYLTPRELEQLGGDIAAAQEPARAIPYGDYTIAGWCQGELLPDLAGMQALLQVLKEDYGVPESQLALLDDQWEQARDQELATTAQPTELSHALRTAITRAGLTRKELCAYAADWNATPGHDPMPASLSGIEFMLNGRRNAPPSPAAIQAIAACTAPLVPSLHALHEQALRDRADSLWNEATIEANFGGMLHALQVRFGELPAQFGERLAACIHRPQPYSGHTVIRWLTGKIPPLEMEGHHGFILCEPIVALAKAADHGKASEAFGDHPWFTPEKEQQFRCAYATALANHDPHYRDYQDIPDFDASLPQASVYAGSLAGKLMHTPSIRSELEPAR